MLEKEDLQAIAQLMDQKLAKQKEDILSEVDTKLAAAKREIAHDTVLLMDAEFTPKFNLLAEGQAGIVERLDRLEEDVADVQATLDLNQAVLRQHTKDIRELKKAQ